MKATATLALCGLILLPACSSTDDRAADLERSLNERIAENENLRRSRGDDEALRLVMAKELEQARLDAELRQAELDRLSRDYEDRLARLRKEAAAPPPVPARRGQDGLDVLVNAKGEVVMRLDHGVTFASGSADLSPAGQKLLRGQVAQIISEHPGATLSIEGHTDDTPVAKSRWGNNLNLSIARALAVQSYLHEAAKVGKDRMRVVGYGETRPLVQGKSADARAKNRRVEIVVLKPSTD